MALPASLCGGILGNIQVGDPNYLTLGRYDWDTNLVTVPAGQGVVAMAFIPKTLGFDQRVALALYSTYSDGSSGQWNYPPMGQDSQYMAFSTISTVDCAPVSFQASTTPIIVGAAFTSLGTSILSMKFLLADGQWYGNSTSNYTEPVGSPYGYADLHPVGTPYIARPGIPYLGGAGIGVMGNRFLPMLYLAGAVAMPVPPPA